MIHRDGNCTSLWQDNIFPYKSFNKLPVNRYYDIVIVGGGITGITTALLLQEAGKKCIVLEAANLCFGTTGGTTAHINTIMDTPYHTISVNFGKENARSVANAAKEAVALIKNNIAQYDIDCEFEDSDAYLFSRDKEQTKELEEIRSGSEEAGISINYSNNIPVPVPFEKAIKIPGQGKFNPVDYVYALAAAFEKAGGIILQQCRVNSVIENKQAEVETSSGKFIANQLIYATHIPPGVNLIHLRCVPYRSYAIAVQLRDDNYPESLCYDMDDPYHYYRTQIINDERYFIAGGYDHKTGHEENTQKCFLELEAHVHKYFDVGTVSYQWSSQYFETTDGLPYIGRLPGHTDLIYVATGYGGNGITYSHIAAKLLKNILLNEETPYLSVFNPNRIKPIAGFKNFITHNADVIKQFAGKWFSHDKLHELTDLANGEGKVIIYEGEKIAL